MIDQNHIYYIFASDQRYQQISSRYNFDQLFPVGLQTGEPYKGLAGAAVSPVLIAS
jgi:hypothetical protein